MRPTLKPLKVFIIGGSNSVIITGYAPHLSHYLGRFGFSVEITNAAVGNTTSLRGLMAASTAPGDFDVCICEYLVNDLPFVKQAGMKTWRSTYESLLSTLRRKNPNALICLPLIGRLREEAWEVQDSMRAEVKKLAKAYGAIITDMDSEFKAIANRQIREFYADDAHYKQGLPSRFTAAMIAGDIAHAIRRGGYQNRAPAQRLSEFSLEPVAVVDLPERQDLAPRVTAFENSRYNLQAVKLAAGEEYRLPITGRALAVGYISALDSADLIITKPSGEQIRIHTLHKRIHEGEYPFLIRTVSLLHGDWASEANCGAITFQAARRDEGAKVRSMAEYNMIANDSLAPQHVYLSTVMQSEARHAD